MRPVKNITTSVRVNGELLEILKKEGITPQVIIDKYIDSRFEFKISEKESKNKD